MFIEATGRMAAVAVERGDRARARRLLEEVLRKLEPGAEAATGSPPLRVVAPGRRS